MNNISEKTFLRAEDIAEYMDISKQAAYRIIRQLNGELKDMGKITISGRVSRVYFESKVLANYSA